MLVVPLWTVQVRSVARSHVHSKRSCMCICCCFRCSLVSCLDFWMSAKKMYILPLVYVAQFDTYTFLKNYNESCFWTDFVQNQQIIDQNSQKYL